MESVKIIGTDTFSGKHYYSNGVSISVLLTPTFELRWTGHSIMKRCPTKNIRRTGVAIEHL